MDKSEILSRLLEAELCLHPKALQELSRYDDPAEIVEKLINRGRKGGIITAEDLKGVEVVVKRGRKPVAKEHEAELRIRDLSSESVKKGGVEDFVEYFRSRYEKGRRVFRERKHLSSTLTVEQVLACSDRAEVKVIGLVDDVKKSRKGNTVILLEDPTGIVPVVIKSGDRELLEVASTIVQDDIICAAGVVFKGKGTLVMAEEISLPDIPVPQERRKAEFPLCIAMISDIHIGSQEFMEREFHRFLRWLRGEIGNQRQQELAEKVKYLLVAGDLVDGVGIYPGQAEDLSIKDIYAQYERLSELFSKVPEHIEVIVSPGNHDATRQAEPQPPIFKDFAEPLYSNPNIHMVGNPCYVELHGTRTLIYHGRSVDDLVARVPGMSYSKPEKAMITLLKKRLLVPVFGERVPVSPGCDDTLFIDEVPHILHCGHVHTTGVASYRGVCLINSGAFQRQTEFQRRINMHPDPGKVPVYDMETGRTRIMKFG